MTSDKKNISLLADLFHKSELENIVISPGSRNAPVILTFANNPNFNCFSIIDERSAAFFALGMALQTKKTTAISCTSGSAVLNYSSAIAEAYYQKIPLLIITADRPKHLIDVGDGQTIRQHKVFKNFVRKSYELPENIDNPKSFKKAERKINKAIHYCMFPEPGPVHINIPFSEPLYNITEEKTSGNLINFHAPLPQNDYSVIETVIEKINNSRKVMVIVGQGSYNADLNGVISKFAQLKNVVVLTETTSNISGKNLVDTIDNVVSSFAEKDKQRFKPGILISLNGQIVSKKVKKFLRTFSPEFHYHINPSRDRMNTYHCLTSAISGNPVDILSRIHQNISRVDSDYSDIWLARKRKTAVFRDDFISTLEYCDLKVFNNVFRKIPENTVLHLGNSTPVRYSQLFGNQPGVEYQSNRGVSGIDGQVSTAAGYAFFSQKQNILITGDLGFLYDSNGLMNHYLKPGFKIIVINNNGGGIFRFIPGPDSTPNLEQFFQAKHNWNAEYICKAFDVDYMKAAENNYREKIDELMESKADKPIVLEIFTPSEKNGELLQEYFRKLNLEPA